MNIQSLQSEVKRQQDEAQSHRIFAESLERKAQEYEAAGDTAKAKTERESAARYFADAERCDSQGTLYVQDIERKQHRASQIEKEIDALKKDFDKKLQHLLDEEKRILN